MLKTFLSRIAATAALSIILVNFSFGQTLSVSGEVATPLILKKEDFSAYRPVTQKMKDRDGTEHDFKGVALIEILEKAGVTTGAKLRGKSLAKFALIKAADGYEVIYSLAEVDPEFTDQTIMVAFEKDGQPLGNGEGPFRMIVSHDRKPARWVREVREIKVGFAKE
ncbi:molybdopterin-dependent oxidoreductase [Dyadobacter luticola]|uniref:Molybdopterin-binding protein n=1 Tax=Dyadobacter luticola TaxID=1979387 RepID=A0A5R9KVJ9_9BACT|nr:molybdopterin-dependent oxidoreductase [Dyadobacter luticola]TLV00292.1 molybdopterin-binding protein [Dyadobacter luticola]